MAKKRRAYQEQAFWANKRLRRYMLAWLRQGGKSTTLAEQSLLEMAEHEGRLITFATASLNLGGEMPEKEAQLWQNFMRDMRGWAEERKMQLVAGERRHVNDADSWRQLPEDIDVAGLADVLEHSKFEVRLRHSQTVSSRLKVIAANVQTARGFTGSVKLDEAPFVDDLRTLMAEMEPIFSTDPTFCFLMAGTPPPDYASYAYELFTPEDGNEDWETNAEGTWFRNRQGIWVHRVTIDDAALAGRKNYHPDTGAEITPDEAREASPDKEGWDRSNRLKRPTVGTSAISPMALTVAQQKGKDRGYHASEWPPELKGLPAGALDKVSGTVTLGMDLGTTEKKTSNPTSIAIQRKDGNARHLPTILWWKSANPDITTAKVKLLLETLVKSGIKVKALGIDATNERHFARILAAAVSQLVTVRLLVGSENVEGKTTAEGMTINTKAYKGNLLAEAGEKELLVCPWNRYVYDDFMRVLKTKGTYDAAVGSQGEHGDTFDAAAAAIMVDEESGPAEAIYPERGDLGNPSRSPHPSWLQKTLDFVDGLKFG